MEGRTDADSYVGPPNEPDRYAIWAIIGSGGEGTVYRGTRTLADGASVSVAIKQYRLERFGLAEQIDDVMSRLDTQVVRLRQFNHRGLAPVHETFAGPDLHPQSDTSRNVLLPYFVMGFVDGDDFKDWMADEPKVTRRLSVLEDAAAALDEVHRHNTVHADVKPSNLRVNIRRLPDGATIPLAVLVDFGLLRLVTDTLPTRVLGSPGYIAPELTARTGPYSPASDLYAFACTAAFAITGRPPTTRDEMLRDASDAGVSPEGLAALEIALDQNPAKRQEALERGVSGWLSSLRGGMSTVSRPGVVRPPRPPRTSAPTRRPSRVPALLTVVVIGGLAAVSLLLWRPWAGSPSSPRGTGEAGAAPAIGGVTTSLPALSSSLTATTVVPSTSSAATAPPTTQPTTTRPRTTTAPPTTLAPPPTIPPQVYVSDLTPIGGGWRDGTGFIGGQPYPHSIYNDFGGCDLEREVQYDLGRDFVRLDGVAGISDSSDSDALTRFEIYVDGVLVDSWDARLGDVHAVSEQVAGGLRLRLVGYFLDGDMGLCSNAGDWVFGDLLLTR